MSEDRTDGASGRSDRNGGDRNGAGALGDDLTDEPLDATRARKRLYEVMREEEPFERKAERAMAIGRTYLDVENGHLTRIDPEGDYWRTIASTDPPDGRFPVGATYPLARTYCRRAIETIGSFALHDVVAQGLEDDPAYEDHDVGCYHGTPVRVDGTVYGTLCFVSVDPREEPFTDAETAFAELVARMLETELLQDRTETQLERLEGFASVVSHDLRNPLNVAQGRVALERETNDSMHLEAAARALDRMEGLIEDVLTMAREGDDVAEDDLRTVRLSDVVDDCWSAVETGSATMTLVDDLRFRAAPSRLTRLVENCFRNAVEHGGSDVTVTVGALPDDDGFYIEDDGPGIPEGDRARVFESGFSTGTGGAGLGLSIVKGIAEAHGWRIVAVEGSDGGARFEIADVIVIE